MKNIKQTTLNAYKVLDILLWVQLREELNDKRDFFQSLDDALEKELRTFSIDEQQRSYVEHYVLCACQVRAWHSHEQKQLLSEKGEMLAKHCELEHPGVDYAAIAQHLNDFELAAYLSLTHSSMERMGISPDTVLAISDNLLNAKKLDFLGRDRILYTDLSLRLYVFKEPRCAIHLLRYLHCNLKLFEGNNQDIRCPNNKPLKDKQLSSEQALAKEALTRVGLFQEFYRICIFMEQCKVGRLKETKHIDVGPFLNSTQHVALETICLPINYFKTRPGRRVLEHLSSDSLKIQVLPIADYEKKTDIEELLVYISQDYELQLLMNPKSKTPYKLGKTTDIICTIMLFQNWFTTKHHGYPLYLGGDNYKAKETKTTELSKILKMEHSIHITSRRLRDTHNELTKPCKDENKPRLASPDKTKGKGRSPLQKLRDEWTWFLDMSAKGIQPWYEVQRDLIDIPGLLSVFARQAARNNHGSKNADSRE